MRARLPEEPPSHKKTGVRQGQEKDRSGRMPGWAFCRSEQAHHARRRIEWYGHQGQAERIGHERRQGATSL
jgi:hypothetical protein